MTVLTQTKQPETLAEYISFYNEHPAYDMKGFKPKMPSQYSGLQRKAVDYLENVNIFYGSNILFDNLERELGRLPGFLEFNEYVINNENIRQLWIDTVTQDQTKAKINELTVEWAYEHYLPHRIYRMWKAFVNESLIEKLIREADPTIRIIKSHILDMTFGIDLVLIKTIDGRDYCINVHCINESNHARVRLTEKNLKEGRCDFIDRDGNKHKKWVRRRYSKIGHYTAAIDWKVQASKKRHTPRYNDQFQFVINNHDFHITQAFKSIEKNGYEKSLEIGIFGKMVEKYDENSVLYRYEKFLEDNNIDLNEQSEMYYER